MAAVRRSLSRSSGVRGAPSEADSPIDEGGRANRRAVIWRLGIASGVPPRGSAMVAQAEKAQAFDGGTKLDDGGLITCSRGDGRSNGTGWAPPAGTGSRLVGPVLQDGVYGICRSGRRAGGRAHTRRRHVSFCSIALDEAASPDGPSGASFGTAAVCAGRRRSRPSASVPTLAGSRSSTRSRVERRERSMGTWYTLGDGGRTMRKRAAQMRRDLSAT